jgi:hypothetical protein
LRPFPFGRSLIGTVLVALAVFAAGCSRERQGRISGAGSRPAPEATAARPERPQDANAENRSIPDWSAGLSSSCAT